VPYSNLQEKYYEQHYSARSDIHQDIPRWKQVTIRVSKAAFRHYRSLKSEDFPHRYRWNSVVNVPYAEDLKVVIMQPTRKKSSHGMEAEDNRLLTSGEPRGWWTHTIEISKGNREAVIMQSNGEGSFFCTGFLLPELQDDVAREARQMR
jgi:hypothetical protein